MWGSNIVIKNRKEHTDKGQLLGQNKSVNEVLKVAISNPSYNGVLESGCSLKQQWKLFFFLKDKRKFCMVWHWAFYKWLIIGIAIGLKVTEVNITKITPNRLHSVFIIQLAMLNETDFYRWKICHDWMSGHQHNLQQSQHHPHATSCKTWPHVLYLSFLIFNMATFSPKPQTDESYLQDNIIFI